MFIRSIINNPCSNKETLIMHNGIINKKRYDDPEKPMKQTSFTVKNLGGNLPKKQSTIIKRSFRSSIKHLSLNSTILVDELTVETFYYFRIFEFFNIWTPHFCMDPSTWLTLATWRCCWLQSSSLHQQWRSISTWLQNPKAQRWVASFRENKALGHFLHVFSLYDDL